MRPRATTLDWAVFAAAVLALLWSAPPVEFYLLSADHGYQLSLGEQILLGRFPFVDLIFHYGPMVAFSSALALASGGGLLAETLLCALGYGSAIALLFATARRWIAPWAGWIAAVAAFALLARFYKWYVWLFPLAVLWCFARQLDDRERRRGDLRLAGIVSGIGGLYRLDYGLAFLVFFASVAAAGRMRGERTYWPSFLAGFTAPFAVWLGTLAAYGGPGAVRDYFAATLVGGTGVVLHWTLPLPPVRWSALVTPQSGLTLGVLLAAGSYAVALAIGSHSGWLRPGAERNEARFMAGAALMGFAVLPQTLHRGDIQHLLQIIPPLLLVAPALLGWIARRSRERSVPIRALCLLPSLAYVALLGTAYLGIRDKAGIDFVPLASNPLPRYRALAGEGVTVPEDPTAELLAEVRRITEPDDYLLVADPLQCQLYYFTHRPMSGLLNGYARGVHDNEEWRRRNLEHVCEHPPRVVIARAGARRGRNTLEETQPELHRLIAAQYGQVVWTNEVWAILAPPATRAFTCPLPL